MKDFNLQHYNSPISATNKLFYVLYMNWFKKKKFMSYIWIDFNFLHSALEYCRFDAIEILHYY